MILRKGFLLQVSKYNTQSIEKEKESHQGKGQNICNSSSLCWRLSGDGIATFTEEGLSLDLLK
jgi:hypothetical protein